MLQYLQTPLVFDKELLQKEFRNLQNDSWIDHYNKSHYEGDWTILPLRSINGRLDNIIATHFLPAGQTYKDTILLEKCPYLQSVLDSFDCEKTCVRLMKLNAGALIKEHVDQDMNIEAGEARFHIPIQTNEDVAFYILEDRVPMQEGDCWYLNLSLPHRVHNAGNTDRIHLVIDCLANDWVKSLLQEPGIKRKEITGIPGSYAVSMNKSNNKQNPSEDRKKVITELRRMNTSVSLELADKMESETI